MVEVQPIQVFPIRCEPVQYPDAGYHHEIHYFQDVFERKLTHYLMKMMEVEILRTEWHLDFLNPHAYSNQRFWLFPI